MGVVYAITRKRTPPDLAARAPAKTTAAFETVGVLVYAMLGQVGGWLWGPALGYRPFSLSHRGHAIRDVDASFARVRLDVDVLQLHRVRRRSLSRLPASLFCDSAQPEIRLAERRLPADRDNCADRKRLSS
jgi:hypothetical protein